MPFTAVVPPPLFPLHKVDYMTLCICHRTCLVPICHKVQKGHLKCHSCALFNHHDTCWRDSRAWAIQELLECFDDNFVLHVKEKPMWRGAVWHLVLTNNKGMVGNVTLKAALNAVPMKWCGLGS